MSNGINNREITYQAGDLRNRITLQRKTVTRSGAGEETVSWSDEATIWAKAEPIRGREYFQAQAVQSEVNMRFVIRFRFVFRTALYRIKFGVKFYSIDSIINIEGLNHFQEIMCTEAV